MQVTIVQRWLTFWTLKLGPGSAIFTQSLLLVQEHLYRLHSLLSKKLLDMNKGEKQSFKSLWLFFKGGEMLFIQFEIWKKMYDS